MPSKARFPPAYAALIADVVASRTHPDRATTQKALMKALGDLNRKWAADLAAPLTLTAGDEIQALLRKPARLVDVIQELTDRFFGSAGFPYLFFGAGWGTLSTGPIPAPPRQAKSPALLDGPAFHAARTALEEAKRSRVWARFLGFGAESDEVLDAIFALMGAVRSKWSAGQGLHSYHSREVDLQKDLAKSLGVSQSVVSESLKAAHHWTLLQAEGVARHVLEKDRGVGHGPKRHARP